MYNGSLMVINLRRIIAQLCSSPRLHGALQRVPVPHFGFTAHELADLLSLLPSTLVPAAAGTAITKQALINPLSIPAQPHTAHRPG